MRRGTLLVLSTVVLALAVAVVVDRPRRAPSEEPGRLFAGLSPASIVRLEIRRAVGTVTLARDARGELALAGQATDEDAVRDLVGSLQTLASRRRAPAAPDHGLEAPRFTVIVTEGARARELLVGKSEPALGWVWVALRGAHEHHLVDEWAARALDRQETDLRQKTLFVDAGGPIVLEGRGRRVAIADNPPRVTLAGGRALADHRKLRALRAQLEELRAVRFAPAAEGDALLSLTVGERALRVVGDCGPGERLAASSVGAVCLAADGIAALDRQLTDAIDWVERAPLQSAPGAARRIDLRPAGAPPLALERIGDGWHARGERLDDAAVEEWLRELAGTRARAVVAAPPVTARPAGADEIMVSGEATEETLWLAGGMLRRPGEPVALAVPADVARFFRADPIVFADRSVLSFEPFGLSEVRIDDERAVRGASLDDWSLAAPVAATADASTIDHLRETAGALRAQKVVAARAVPAHGLSPPRRTLTLVLAAPPGGERPAPLVLELGAVTASGACHARRGGTATVYLLAPDDCRAVDVHLAERAVFPSGDVLGATVDGRPLAGDELAELARSLGRAPSVTGYGALAGRELVLDTAAGPVTLVFRGREYARADRPVRYRVAAEACQKWPSLCR